MTEFEDLDGPGADESGAQARELFMRTAAGTRPQLGFTAEALVTDGRRRVRRRRVAAALGSMVSVAAIAAAATAFAAGGGARGTAVSVGGTVTSSAGSAGSASSAGSTSSGSSAPTSQAKPPSDDERTIAEKKLAAAVFGEMMGRLDPGIKHLTYSKPPKAAADFWPDGGVCTEKTKTQDSYAIHAFWTADGKNPFPRAKDATSPYIQVSIDVYAPGQQIPDQFRAADGWGPLTRTQLPDDSVVRTASAAQGHHLQTIRTMANGQQIVFEVEDDSIRGGGPWGAQALPTNPFPFTAEQLSAIVSGVSLPLPFADGSQPHTVCGP